MPAAGYYKTSHRALRLGEMVRRFGWWRGLKAYWKARSSATSTGGTWMPGSWAETECRSEDLSEEFRLATKPHQKSFEELGFNRVRFFKVKSLHSTIRDSGGATYLDPTGCHVGTLHFMRVFRRAQGRLVNEIVISFAAAFETGLLSCSNRKRLFDMVPPTERVYVNSYNAKIVYEKFLEVLRRHQDAPRRFPDVPSLRQWFDERQIKAFEERVQRGLFVPMSDEEVAAAKAKFESGVIDAPSGRRNLRWAMFLVLLGCICTLQFFLSPEHHLKSDTIEYRGQEFKMSRPYATYEDYKDDPNNLDTNELDRIEQAMVSAPVPKSFKNNQEFFHFLIFDLGFPGYGEGSIGENAKTDDSSMLLVETVEIPQRDKDRVLTLRQSGEELKVIDDFVYGYSTVTNQIRHVKLQNKVLRYYDDENRLIREKQL